MSIDLVRIVGAIEYDPAIEDLGAEPAQDLPAAADAPSEASPIFVTPLDSVSLDELPGFAAGDTVMLAGGLDAPIELDLPVPTDPPPAAESGLRRMTILATGSHGAASKSKYTIRYTYTYRYATPGSTRMVHVVLRPRVRPQLANAMASTRTGRGNGQHGHAARHPPSAEMRRASLALIESWRDGMLQLRAPSMSNYERSVDARLRTESIDDLPELAADGAAGD